MEAHRNCTKCSGKSTIWFRGNEVYRVTGRKDKYGEVHDFICNECRFDKKEASDWTIEGPSTIVPSSVLSQNHYKNVVIPSVINPIKETME